MAYSDELFLSPDVGPIPNEKCDFTKNFEKEFRKLKSKQADEKAELVNGINKLAEIVHAHIQRNISITEHQNIIDIKGVEGVFEFRGWKKNNLRIYFKMRGNRPLIKRYGKKTTQNRKDIEWLRNNPLP